MRRLVVNADVFGLSPGVNEGIVRAHAEGIVTSASLMVLARSAPEAVRAASDHAGLSIGLHFVDDGSVDLDDPAGIERSYRAQLPSAARALQGAHGP